MHLNPQYNQKLSQVIHLALNYKNHRKSLESIKPALKIPSLQKIQQNQSLKHNQIKYAHQSRQSRQNEVQKSNRLQTSRIIRVESTLKSIYSEQCQNKTKKIAQNKNNQLLPTSKSRSSQRPSSHRSISSNFGTRQRRQKQIAKQNKQIAKRVQHPKMSKQLNSQYFDKQFIKQQEYLQIRSRFSQRSKSIMLSLTLEGLKMNKRDLGFLPQIGSHDRNIKSKEYKTLDSSRSSYRNGKERQQGMMGKSQAIRFLSNIPKNTKTKQRYLV